MIRITLKAKLTLAAVALLFVCAAGYVMFKPAPEVIDLHLDRPAALPNGVKFPLEGQDRDRFAVASAKTRAKLGVCNFFSGYAPNRGKPLAFQALIPDNARTSPYFYADAKTGREYWPAYFIAPTPSGLDRARAAASGTAENVEPCALAPDNTAKPILLGFDRGRKPASGLVSVQGLIWWDSVSLNPAQQTTSAGAATVAVPVVRVGAAEGVSVSQVARPAFKHRILNMAFQHGPAILRIGRIEFAAGQTRVWVELLNKTSLPLPAWSAESVTLREQGGSSMAAGSDEAGEDEGVKGAADELPVEEIPAKGGGALRGYLTFPEVDPGTTLYLNLPEINTLQDSMTAPLTIKLDPTLNVPVS